MSGLGNNPTYSPGDWNATCYACGRPDKASNLVLHWQGYYVCKEHWEARHPQDFVRSPPDVQTPPWTQPTPAPIFVYVCSSNGITAIVDFATAGCAITDYISPTFNPDLPPGD